MLINPSVDRVLTKHIVVNGLKDPKTKETINYAFYVGKKLNASRITVVEEVGQDEVNIRVDDDKTLRQSTIIRTPYEQRKYACQKIIGRSARGIL